MHPLADDIALIEREFVVAEDVRVGCLLRAAKDVIEITTLGGARRQRTLEHLHRHAPLVRCIARLEQPTAGSGRSLVEQFVAAREEFFGHWRHR